MANSNSNKLKRVMCGLLSALTMLSGTAVAGTAVTATASAAEVDTAVSSAKEVTPATFSWDNATVYFLLTDRFKNGNPSNDNSYGRRSNLADTRATFHGGDFAGITQKINEGYFENLGVDAIWLSAPYEQIHGYIQGGSNFYHYSYHGYYVLDYTETDANFGTKEEFKELVDTAHEHGIRIIMDIVMNHAGYVSMYDMNEYGFGVLKSGWDTFYANPGSNAEEYQSYIAYDSGADAWAKWWGADWIRSGVAGYSAAGDGSSLTECVAGLPDFKTENTKSLSIPAILQTKWTKEGTLAAKSAKYGSSGTVTDFITKWLAEWVREYGVDGFRCDTAKHVEKSSWKKLKDACVPALREWKQNNPDKAVDNLDFWMTGEHWEHGVGKDDYYTTGGFDSMINFDMTGGGSLDMSRVSGKYNDYANAINKDDSFNVLSYISSHDTTLARGDCYYLGSAFLMLPGAVQIYYGDETARPKVSGIPDDSYASGHCLRSDMNWDSYDPELLAHWGKVGNFRSNHIAVGAGANTTLTASSGVAFGRTYSKNGLEDKVAGVIGATASTDVSVDVSAIWADGTMLENFYDESVAVVSGGKVSFNSGAHGTILIQEPDGERGRVTVTHIDQDSGETMKKETLVGLIGESYTATPLTTLGYKLAKTVGSKTGTYSDTEASVTFYYSFDSTNYAHIVTKYVDVETGAEIAESDSQVGKIGSSYTTEAKTIKNYEVDTVPSNAAGTVKSGTTTVTYKYSYVEPTNLQVHYYNSNSWSAVNLYAYTGSGATATQLLGAWPGKSMTSEGDGWFFGEVPDIESASVMFNNGAGAQEPGKEQPGYEATGEVWIKSAKLYPTGKVNVKYISTDGKVLGSDIVKGMADGTNKYTTSAKTFSGYTLSATPSNASGTLTEGSVNVTYTYTPDVPINDLKNNSTVSSTLLTVGDTLTIKGAASGGTSPYKYAYYYQRTTSTGWTTLGTAFGTATSATLKPSSAGTFNIKVVVRDNKGAEEEKSFTVTFKAAPTKPTNTSTVSAGTLDVGKTLTIKGSATGGTAPYKYAYYYKRVENSTWRAIGTEFGTATSATLTPSSTGTFDVKVIVKDNNKQTAEKTFNVTFKAVKELENKSTVSATSVTAGSAVTVTGKAAGGSGAYQYAFFYKKSSASAWTTIGTQWASTSGKFTASAVGTYDVKVVVRDKNNTSSTKRALFTVTAISNKALENNSTVSGTNIALGNTLTITGKAAGGSGAYQYAFFYKRTSSDNWVTLGTQWGTATTAKLTPSTAGTFDIKVVVRDKNNTSNTKRVLYTVTFSSAKELTNNSTVSGTNIVLGNTLTMTGKAAGGSGAYQYAFFYKRTTSDNWVTLGTQWGAATTATLTPSTAGTFDIKIVVRDKNNTSNTKRVLYTVTFSGKTALANNSSVVSTSVAVGKAITLKGAASGGTGSYKYAYYYKRTTSSNWIAIGTEFGTATSASFTPSSAGSFDLMVKVQDTSGETISKTFAATAK